MIKILAPAAACAVAVYLSFYCVYAAAEQKDMLVWSWYFLSGCFCGGFAIGSFAYAIIELHMKYGED